MAVLGDKGIGDPSSPFPFVARCYIAPYQPLAQSGGWFGVCPNTRNGIATVVALTESMEIYY